MKKYFIFSILLLTSMISITGDASRSKQSEKYAADATIVEQAITAITSYTPSFNAHVTLGRGATTTFGDLKTATVRRSHCGKFKTLVGAILVEDIRDLTSGNTRKGKVTIYPAAPGALIANVTITKFPVQ